MKQHILSSIRLTLVCILLFMIVYPLAIWLIAQLGPAKGYGEPVLYNDKIVGYKLLGQRFSEDKYFWGRPSAAGYNAAASAGSNKGTSNPEYLESVKEHVREFLSHNPKITMAEIPSDLVTASGSGLDPDISVLSARVQVRRIATSRKISEIQIEHLIEQHSDHNFFGLFGPAKVNVLELNIDLDKTK